MLPQNYKKTVWFFIGLFVFCLSLLALGVPRSTNNWVNTFTSALFFYVPVIGSLISAIGTIVTIILGIRKDRRDSRSLDANKQQPKKKKKRR